MFPSTQPTTNVNTNVNTDVNTDHQELEEVAPVSLAAKLTSPVMPIINGPDPGLIAASIICGIFGLATIVVWILGLVRMGKCENFAKHWLFWVTLLGFIFIPGIGQLFGLVVAIIALVVLKPGGGDLFGLRYTR